MSGSHATRDRNCTSNDFRASTLRASSITSIDILHHQCQGKSVQRSMMSETEESSTHLFRSMKRRKIVQRRHFDDEDSNIEKDELASHVGTGNGLSDTPLTSRLKPKTHLPRRHGIAFAAHEHKPKTQIESIEPPTAVVPSAASDEPPQIERFMKPTGRVGVVEDKHLYV